MRSQRPPPDIRTKSAQWQLFVLVAGLMTVLVAMNEARKPTTWAWLWTGLSQNGDAIAPVNTRLPPQPGPVDSGPTVVHADRAKKPPGHAELAATDARESSRQAWATIWSVLSSHDQQQLMRLFRAVRLGINPTATDSQEWQFLLTRMDRSWSELFMDRNGLLLVPGEEVTAERRRTTVFRWTELEIAWNSKWKPALLAAAEPRVVTAEERGTIIELEDAIELIALTDVEDDTVWRPDERTAWFRLIDRLQTTSDAELRRQSVGQVGFAQIFRQSREYRGRVVTVRGTARLVYRVAAPRNELGIRDYSLFWIQPEDGSNLPIVVYALHPPSGFPEVTAEPYKIKEPVEVTGYFFKRWVYRAADGLNSVPLVLTSSPLWHPTSPPARSVTRRIYDSLGPLFWPAVAIGIIGLGLGAWSIAWLVNWSSRPSAALAELRSKTNALSPAQWESLPDTPSISESLRRIEDDAPHRHS